MLRLAGKHANICYIPPWIDFAEAKETALNEAKRWKRQHELAFAAGAPSVQPPYLGPKYNPNIYAKRIEEAKEAGCDYFIVPFPRKTYRTSMKRFAEDILPSFDDDLKGFPAGKGSLRVRTRLRSWSALTPFPVHCWKCRGTGKTVEQNRARTRAASMTAWPSYLAPNNRPLQSSPGL